MRAIDNGTHDGASDEADEEEYPAAQPRLFFRISVRIEDLVQERGKDVEEADIGAECDKGKVERWRAEHVA